MKVALLWLIWAWAAKDKLRSSNLRVLIVKKPSLTVVPLDRGHCSGMCGGMDSQKTLVTMAL